MPSEAGPQNFFRGFWVVFTCVDEGAFRHLLRVWEAPFINLEDARDRARKCAIEKPGQEFWVGEIMAGFLSHPTPRAEEL